jgi:hypothetical protein
LNACHYDLVTTWQSAFVSGSSHLNALPRPRRSDSSARMHERKRGQPRAAPDPGGLAPPRRAWQPGAECFYQLPPTLHSAPTVPTRKCAPHLSARGRSDGAGWGKGLAAGAQRPHPSLSHCLSEGQPRCRPKTGLAERQGSSCGAVHSCLGSRQARSRRHTLQCTAAGSRQARS